MPSISSLKATCTAFGSEKRMRPPPALWTFEAAAFIAAESSTSLLSASSFVMLAMGSAEASSFFTPFCPRRPARPISAGSSAAASLRVGALMAGVAVAVALPSPTSERSS